MINGWLIKEFGLRIKQLRTEKKISQEKLSEKRNISLTNIAVFAKAFKMTVSELLDFSSINPKHSYKKYETKIED